MFLGFFSAIVLNWTNPTQQKIAKVINFHPILTKILVSVFYTVKSAHLNSPIFKRNFLAIYKGNTQIFLLHRVQQVSKYLLSRLHKGSDRFLKNQGPTGGDPLNATPVPGDRGFRLKMCSVLQLLGGYHAPLVHECLAAKV